MLQRGWRGSQGMVLRFAGFELDRLRATLRRPTGEAVKLRPKTLALLVVFSTNAGRVLSKQQLMDAVWPDVHVGEDSLFQCIREIRTALCDDRRTLIRVVSGSGYLFEAEVSMEDPRGSAEVPTIVLNVLSETSLLGTANVSGPRPRLRHVMMALGGFGGILGLAAIVMLAVPGHLRAARPPSIEVMPIASIGGGDVAAMAANMTTRLADRLAQIDNISVLAPLGGRPADYVVSGELRKNDGSWEAQMRMSRTASGEVVWTAPVSVVTTAADLSLQQSRLIAGAGYPLALRINALMNEGAQAATTQARSSSGSTKVVIEQANASIVHTSRERFAASQAMLEKALADDPDNVDLAIALAALQMRGVQMVWYDQPEGAAAQANAGLILKNALRTRPTSIPVLDAYCRFLNATNEVVDSLVICARTLNFNPWHAPALTHIGLAQLLSGRFEDGLASFKRADAYDTPQVSRWTWQLNIGMTYLLMGRSGEALPWLERSIAITPASGRSHMLLSAAYMGLGRPAEARAAMETGMALRPGSNLGNVLLPTKNASPVFVKSTEWVAKAFLTAGLPEH
jgi:DNA-binding winged helix-turn-helix (wHTH) protein/tetratricopeptide (TPR) repeat protein